MLSLFKSVPSKHYPKQINKERVFEKENKPSISNTVRVTPGSVTWYSLCIQDKWLEVQQKATSILAESSLKCWGVVIEIYLYISTYPQWNIVTDFATGAQILPARTAWQSCLCHPARGQCYKDTVQDRLDTIPVLDCLIHASRNCSAKYVTARKVKCVGNTINGFSIPFSCFSFQGTSGYCVLGI